MLVYYNTSCFSYCWKVVNSGVFDHLFTNTYTHVCKKCNDQIDLLKEMQRVTETNYESFKKQIILLYQTLSGLRSLHCT